VFRRGTSTSIVMLPRGGRPRRTVPPARIPVPGQCVRNADASSIVALLNVGVIADDYAAPVLFLEDLKEMTDIALGGLPIPASLLLLFGSIFAALTLGNRLAKEDRSAVERLIWLVVVLMLLAARIAFVASYRDVYMEEPLRVLDVRDGGFRPAVGLAAGVAAAAWIAWSQAARRKPLLAALAAGCAVWLAGGAALSTAAHRQTLPIATLTTLDGSPVKLQSMLGKPVIMNLWTSWCPPCRREMPVLAKAQADHPEVTFVFANQGETEAAVRAYLAREGLRLDNLLLDDATALSRATASPGLPTTLFFDARGKLVDRRMGELSPATLEERLDLLRQATSGNQK
jgi:thiol-disulfide isomerase/thioredoxin